MEKTSYSLWLLPSLAVRGALAQAIHDLSRRLSTPTFEPHITLAAPAQAAEAEIVAHAERFAANLASVPIRFDGIGHTEAYFRCLFLRAEKSAVLLAAHRQACAELGRPPEADYMPHLSLVYGRLDTGAKLKLIEEIGRRLPTSILSDRLGVCTMVGPPDAWKVRSFPLRGARA